MMNRFFIVVFIFLSDQTTWALVYDESSLLGKVDESIHVDDPLEKIAFQGQTQNENLEQSELQREQKKVFNYRQLLIESETLLGRCKHEEERILYASEDYQQKALRSIVETFRYISLEALVPAVAGYALLNGVSAADFEKLSQNLVHGTCSQNLAVISHKFLIQNLNRYYQLGEKNLSALQLPSYQMSALFAPSLLIEERKKKAQKIWSNEFHYILLTFRSLCSWGGDLQNLQRLGAFLKNPILLNMTLRSLLYGDQVLCDGFVCRRRETSDFLQGMPRAAGSNSLQEDVERLMCQELFLTKKVKEKELLKEEEILMQNQLISLLSGVPDSTIRSTHFNEVLNKSSRYLDGIWNKWSQKLLEQKGQNFLYEESIVVEKIPRALFFNPYDQNYALEFEVVQGEMDRLHWRKDKISLQMNLSLDKPFLLWFKKSAEEGMSTELLLKQLYLHLDPSFQREIKRMVLLPWKGDLLRLVAYELLGQIQDSNRLLLGKRRRESDELFGPTITIPLRIYYAPMALRYLYYRFKSERGQLEIDL